MSALDFVGHETFMLEAIALARAAAELQEVPIGAVVVDSAGVIIGRGFNHREQWKDPTAHAEMIALREAASAYGDWRLRGCRLYVTVEPCVMCAGAIQLARIEEVVYGADNVKGGALRSALALYQVAGFNHYPRITAGVLGESCAMMLADFFRTRRR